jgi:50S ribosomal protein L16 3-hydroxylase
MKSPLLGGLTARDFLRRYWQKRPLFVRDALPQFPGVLDARTLSGLAARDDVESRIVERRGRRRETAHGPFSVARSTSLKPNSTILVNGVNHHVAAADALLQRFAFVPQARLDDVMVSYATPGGGVGPHIDRYDVFLLQGPGRRLWRVQGKRYLAHPGDLLYLPPGVRHDGVALDRCFTYSIGFRAPRGTELAAAFLDWLHERGLPDARYADPGLRPVRHPAKIPGDLLRFSSRLLEKIDWTSGDAAEFLGRFLTEPKAHVVFRPARSTGPVVALDPKTQLLYDGRRFFVNGESFSVPAACAPVLRELADRRAIERRRLAGGPLAALISGWLRSGYARLQRIQP